jgi:hypothetical protein
MSRASYPYNHPSSNGGTQPPLQLHIPQADARPLSSSTWSPPTPSAASDRGERASERARGREGLRNGEVCACVRACVYLQTSALRAGISPYNVAPTVPVTPNPGTQAIFLYADDDSAQQRGWRGTVSFVICGHISCIMYHISCVLIYHMCSTTWLERYRIIYRIR